MISGRSGVGSMISRNRVADLLGVFQFGAGVGLRAVLEAPLGAGVLLGLLDAQSRAVGGDLLHIGAVGAEHHTALQDRRRVVEVDDRPRGADAGLERAGDEFRSALRQHLDRHVVGDRALFDDLANEVEVRLARRREADLDLLVTHPHQQLEHAVFTGRAHGVDQRLIAVPQIDRTPHGGLVDDLVRPFAVGYSDLFDLVGEAAVTVDGHRGAALGVPDGLGGIGCAGGRRDGAYRREGVGRI